VNARLARRPVDAENPPAGATGSRRVPGIDWGFRYGGRVVFDLFGALAEFERQLIRDRTLAGLAAARARGRVGGRPRTMTPAKLRLARAMREQTPPVSLGQIGVELGLAKSTVARNLAAQSPTAVDDPHQAGRGRR